MKKEIFASLIVLLLIVMALSGCTDENIDNVDENNGAMVSTDISHPCKISSTIFH